MNRFMEAAVEEACVAVTSAHGGPFGAVIVYDGKIVARAHNTVLLDNDPTAHAEMNAIREAARTLGSYHLSDCDIYTSCEPCPMCYAAIYWARLGRIFHGATRADAAAIGFDDDAIYRDLADPKGERDVPLTRLDREECLEPFRLWESTPNRVTY
ncbi:MAG: nucleoside deaminase [Spirochaetaceae bacterium]